MSEKLKGCPHCGEEPMIDSDGLDWWVLCCNPHCQGIYKSKDKAVKAWNVRV